ncbi:hypothetical protein AAFF_G00106480 [Aldrovandia affinis]|uniref:Retinal cone rhodopsin-sensitive cGMP 3',5'-cyclic phosphodiesterase subunit gamma n=1 Tax=Aldrovandia affinis TaxID=143900 RepID=A0AAD7WXB9_9TELE|nr:hypothetical protein AAFF_G00106480 [Aldrovandia affinis]
MNAGAEAAMKKSPMIKLKDTNQFKSKAPKPGQKGCGDGIPGMEGLGSVEVVCPWEMLGDMELSNFTQFGII